jgi:hypothetical protein
VDTEHQWHLLLKECDKKNSRLIFTGLKLRNLIDITIQSPYVDNVVNRVLSSNWSADQVIDFLNSE